MFKSMMTPLPIVDIFASVRPGSDGSAAWAVILSFGTRHRKEFSGWKAVCGVDQAALLAVADGLERLTRPCRVRLFSDITVIADLPKMVQRWDQEQDASTDEVGGEIRSLLQVHEVDYALIETDVSTIQEAADLAQQAIHQGSLFANFLLGKPTCLDPEPQLSQQSAGHAPQKRALWGQRRKSA